MLVWHSTKPTWCLDRQTTLNNGNVVDWQPFQPHEFISLESDSRIVNIIKNHQKQK